MKDEWKIAEEQIQANLKKESKRADEKFGGFHSSHEGLGVLLEEFDELKAAIHENHAVHTYHEAIQVASVALRLARSICDEDCRERSGMEQ